MGLFKFKAWHKNQERMILPESTSMWDKYFLSIGGKSVTEGDSGSLRSPEPYFPANADYVEFLLYSELIDSSGINICEGDIVKILKQEPREGNVLMFYEAKICSIIYENGCFFVTDNERLKEMLFEVSTKLMVIGNIYETPELLSA